MAQPILGYYDITGLAQHIRLLLEYTGTDYENKIYTPCRYEHTPAWKSAAWYKERLNRNAQCVKPGCWMADKFKLGLDFPNLPYYIDGKIKLTHNNAIMRHIAGKNDLLGDTEEERARVALMENQVFETRYGLVELIFDPKFETAKLDYIADIPNTLRPYSEFLSTNVWFAGDKITFVDFILYQLFHDIGRLNAGCLDMFPNLKQFYDNFEKLEKISKYLQSGRVPTALTVETAYFRG